MSAPITRRHTMVVAGAASVMVFAGMLFLTPSFVNPPIAREFGVGLGQVMVFTSIMSLAGALSMMLAGPWVVRVLGPRRVLMIGGLWCATCLVAVSFATSLVALYVLGFVLGLMSALQPMMATVLVNTWFEARRGAMLGVVSAVSGSGGVLLGLAMPSVIGALGWRGGYRALAVAALLLVSLASFVLVRSRPAEVGLLPAGACAPVAGDDAGPAIVLPGVPMKRAFATPHMLFVLGGIVCLMVVQAMQQHLVPLFTERGVDAVAGGTLVSVLSLAMIGATLMIGTLNDRFGTQSVLWVVASAGAASLVLLVFARGYLPLALGVVVFAVSCSLPGVIVPLVVMAVFGPRDYGQILGPVTSTFPISMAIGAPAWGFVKDALGSYDLALWAGAGLSGVGALLLWTALRTAPAMRARIERELT